MKIIIALGIILIFGISYSSCKRYDGYKLYRVPFGKDQHQKLWTIVNKVKGTEFWLMSIAEGIADIFTAPEAESELLSLLVNNNFVFTLSNADIQSLIDGDQVV